VRACVRACLHSCMQGARMRGAWVSGAWCGRVCELGRVCPGGAEGRRGGGRERHRQRGEEGRWCECARV
jgi:hypothetical protein